MRFLLNANIGRIVAEHLSEAGYPTILVADILPKGASDKTVLNYSVANEYILITRDKSDFGDLVFRQHHPFFGVVVCRTQTAEDDDKVLEIVLKAIKSGIIAPQRFLSL